MADPIEALILDLLEWIGPSSRPYAEVMDAWHTSCPRLTVWEDATERGLVESSGGVVRVTPRGRALLVAQRRSVA